MSFEPRFYRSFRAGDLYEFRVQDGETDLQILGNADIVEQAAEVVRAARSDLHAYIARFPEFETSFSPLEASGDAPELVRDMCVAGKACDVGPMAAVAGAIAERVARECNRDASEIIVENGGDIYICGQVNRVVALWAGQQGLSRIGIEIDATDMPIAVATSSGRVGHSFSFGKADAVCVLSHNGALADAMATACANRVRVPEDIENVLAYADTVPGILGIVVTIDGALGASGKIRLVPTEKISD
ncbi:MAG: UPF0280 family protein [Actinobacteria bacterium]|nr:UPF0280 family protein [Actinomycetota bacterium]